MITGAKALYPDRKITVIFQPHLFTRTRDLAEGFAESLDLADEVWLLPIYPARELPIEGVDSSIISNKMMRTVVLVDKEQILSFLDKKNPALLITAGAGDIDKLINPIKEKLISKS